MELNRYELEVFSFPGSYFLACCEALSVLYRYPAIRTPLIGYT